MSGEGTTPQSTEPEDSAAEKDSSGPLLEAARKAVSKLDNRKEVRGKTDPIDLEALKRSELRARTIYTRRRRDNAGPVQIFTALLGWRMARLQRRRPVRAMNLFFFHYGTVMAAGAAYMMFFSISALLFAGFSVAGIIIGGNQEYQDLTIQAVNNVVPGILGPDGLLEDPYQLFDTGGVTWAVAVAVVIAIVTSLSWMHGLRAGIRSIWDRPLMDENVVFVKIRDLGVMALLGVVALSSAVLGVASQVFISDIFDFIGWDAGNVASLLVRIATGLIALGLDMIVAVLLMRVASRLVMPVGALWQSALIAGLGASLLRLASTTLLNTYTGDTSDASTNPILASGGVMLGMFFYFFLFGLVYMVAASWGAIAAAARRE